MKVVYSEGMFRGGGGRGGIYRKSKEGELWVLVPQRRGGVRAGWGFAHLVP